MSRYATAIAMLTAAVVGLIYTGVAGNRPLLGLDLQGGVAVVYEPTEPATDENLDLAIEVIRNRVDGLGVAEPEITRQDQDIIVSLPGAEEQRRALELVGETAELRFRPVILELGFAPPDGELPTEDTVTEGTDTEGTVTEGTDGEGTVTEDSDSEETDSSDTSDTEEESMGTTGRFGANMIAQDETTTTEDEADTTTDDTATDDTATVDGDEVLDSEEPLPELTPAQTAALETCFGTAGTTPRDDDDPDSYAVLADSTGSRFCVGPALARGDVLEDAIASLDGFGTSWIVSPTFKPGADGIDQFNAAAVPCATNDPDVCPSGRLAMVLDQEVLSAPTVQTTSFERDRVEISGSFDQESAQDLALRLRYGALPVQLEAQQTQTVSATIGEDVLRSGVMAGIIGLVIVSIYLLWFYRLAGLVAILGVGLSASFAWTLIAWLGSSQGLALTLAGVVGLIVAIGVSADSNIVYFENVKDLVRDGTRMGTAVERAFQSAFSTIVKADVVSLIAAGLLWWLTVGAVRGFAFYLGLATVLDLIVSWLFMRPALAFFASRSAVEKNPRLLGLPGEVKV